MSSKQSIKKETLENEESTVKRKIKTEKSDEAESQRGSSASKDTKSRLLRKREWDPSRYFYIL